MNTPLKWLIMLALSISHLLSPLFSAHASHRNTEEFLFLPWDTSVGRFVGQEADSEGPKSFAVKSHGGALLLDQVNLRILDFNDQGDFLGSIPIPSPTFDDIEQFDNRFIVVLDRLVTQTLLVMDFSGTPLFELELKGRGIEHSGLITAMFSSTDGIWLEISHRYSVKVLDKQIKPCNRQIIMGRPIDKGESLHGELDGEGGANIWISDRYTMKIKSPITVSSDIPFRRIVWLDKDPSGTINAIFHEAQFDKTSPYALQNEQYNIIKFNHQLIEENSIISPHTLTLYDQRVEFRIDSKGVIWQLAFDEKGIFLIKWRLQ
jgi:hypothetical protein